MMASRQGRHRYCRCGTLLAKDNPGRQCARCERASRGKLIAPPEVPPEFWDTEQFREAFAAQHIGRVARAYRTHPSHHAVYGLGGISQTLLGQWIGLRQPHVSRIETGPPIRHLDTLQHWAKTLRIPPRWLWFKLSGHSSAAEGIHVPEARSALAIPAQGQSPFAVPTVAAFGLLPAAIDVVPGVDADAFTMQAFRAADKQVGGGHLYATVVKYLHTEIAPRLFGGDDNPGSRRLYSAAAALTEMAGWMAHDAGRDGSAQQHFSRSLDLVKVGGDRQLGAHIFASMSHLAHHRDQPHQAIQFARRGQEALAGGPRQPEIEARLLAMQARGCAGLGEPGECTQLLRQAEKALTHSPAGPPSPWVSRFDEGSLASESARCLRQLGDLSEAQRQAERIIALRSGDHTRSRAFGQLILVTVFIGQGKPDEACAVAQEVLSATPSLGSFLVIQQLLDLKQLLEPHRANTVVTDFLVCLDETLRERMWLYRWLAKGVRTHTAGLGEDV